jgi:MFS transporter, ENTS family, enterobactin (siderophore) exporter
VTGVSTPFAAPRNRVPHSRRRILEVPVYVLTSVTLIVLAALSAAAPPWRGDPLDGPSFVGWTLQALSEPQFSIVTYAGVGLLLGGWFGHIARQRRWRIAGFTQACGTGLWPAVAAAALASLLLSNLMWGWTLAGGGWQPLFVPIASVAPAVVVVYGPATRVIATASVLGAVIATPLALVLVNLVCTPLGIAPVIGVTGAMAVAAAPAFALCQHLGWMPEAWRWRTDGGQETESSAHGYGPVWILRRALADFSEAQFFGSEWAGAGVIVGAVIGWLTVPGTVAYGSGLLPAILAAQTVSALLAVAVWRGRWRRAAFYPTFVPIVSVAPAAVLALAGSPVAVCVAVVLGVILGPPLAAWISGRVPLGCHPYVGNVASMAVTTLVVVTPLSLVVNGVM